MAEVVIAIIGAVLGLAGVIFGGWVTLIQGRRDSTVENIRILVDNLQEEISRSQAREHSCQEQILALRQISEKDYQERLELKKMIGVMQQQILDMRAGIQLLIQQLRKAGLEPEWKPGTGPLFKEIVQ